MMNLIESLLILTLAVQSGLQLVLADTQHQQSTQLDGFYGTLEQHFFRRINDWLTSRLHFRHIDKQEQVEQVFEVLGQLVEHTNRQLLMYLSAHQRENYKEAQLMLSCLEKITSLAQLDASRICLNSSYHMLLSVDAATGYRSHLDENDGYFSLELYKKKLVELKTDILAPLKEFIQQIIKLRVGNYSFNELNPADIVALTRLEKSPSELQVLLVEMNSMASSNEQRITLETMKHEPRDEVHRTSILIDVKRMLSNHSGCRYYVDEMGESVFSQARYDLLFRDSQRDTMSQDVEYYEGWLIYGICLSILKRVEYIAIPLIELAQRTTQ